jgi:predicted kinase
MLVVFGGLPGVGKTAIAMELARQLGAVHLRIDSIEQAIRESSLIRQPLKDMGYRVGYAVAEDNLRLGRIVIADSVNPLQLTRDAWIAVAQRSHVKAIEIEVTCSDPEEHRKRAEARVADIAGLSLPTWQEIVDRKYEPWVRPRVVVDTAGRSVTENVRRIRDVLPQD